MVSTYSVAKEGAVGVAVGVGAMHCLLPHCAGGPHHLSPHPQNPNHNHVHPHNHQPPPPLSPHGHLTQLNHPQHQLTININHHHHQQQQQQQQSQQSQQQAQQSQHQPPRQQPQNEHPVGPQQHQQQQPPPPQYRIVATNAKRETVNGRRNLPAGMTHQILDLRWARHGNSLLFRSPGSEFHVPGQNYVAQQGGHVGGGGGSVGVPGGRGPPSLGGIQTLGQATPGIQPGGPPSGQQQPPQAQTPGVQQQATQGPAPTTTPPVHTPSPQEMGKQAHLQAQPQHQQVYMSNQTRPMTQGYFQTGPRPQPSRNLGHRNNQGASGTPVVAMPGGGGGQPATLYPHQGLQVPQGTPMYDIHTLQQVPGLHAASHQQAMYPPANLLQLYSPQQRHQAHQGQSFYSHYTPHTIVPAQNMYQFPPGQGPQPSIYFPPPPATQLNISRASNAVSGGAQHVGGPLAGAQGAGGVPQGALQQPSQQPQPIPSMAIPLTPAEVYAGHNGGTSSASGSSARPSIGPRTYAIMDIRDPNTGDNIAADIYGNASSVSNTSSNRETPQNQELVAEFAARVAKAASEESETSLPTSAASTSGGSTTTTTTSTSHTGSTSVATSSASQVCQPTVSVSTSAKATSKETTIQSNAGVSMTTTTSTTTTTTMTTTMTTPTTTSSVTSKPQSSSRITITAPVASSAPQQQSSSAPQEAVSLKPEPKSAQHGSEEAWQQSVSVTKPKLVSSEEVLNVAPTAAPALASKETVSSSQAEASSVPAVPSATASAILEPKEPPKSSANVPTSVNAPASSASAPANASETPTHPSNTASQAAFAAASQTSSASSSSSVTPSSAAPAPSAPQTTSSFPGPLPTRPPRFVMYSGPDSSAFPTLASKSSSSPPRRKNQPSAPSAPANSVTEPPAGKELPKERKMSDRGTSRGTTPTPAHNQTEHHQRSNGETALDKTEITSDIKTAPDHHYQKSNDGKAMQKQKNKNKTKRNDLNRKGAEKEGTDMDAFVNPVAVPKPEGGKTQSQNQQQDNRGQSAQLPPPVPLTGKEDDVEARDTPKVAKDRENNETKIETSGEVESEKKSMSASMSDATRENVSTPAVAEPTLIIDETQQQQNNRETAVKEATPSLEENENSNQGVCNLTSKTLSNDVIERAKPEDEIDVETIVAQKNEENAKVSALHATANEKKDSENSVIEKQDENEAPNENDSTKSQPRLKYAYEENQWSPRNVTGKKEYGRDFLMRLQDDPMSRLPPRYLPEMEVVLKECAKSRSTEFRSFKDTNPSRQEALLPGFARSTPNTKMPIVSKKSYQGKSKVAKSNLIHMSISVREDVKLRETENAWRPARMKAPSGEEDVKTTQLYKKVRSVLNKLTPEKFDTLVSQVRSLEIDTQEKLQGVIDLVFEKAVDEPNFSVAYALMCKELGMIKVKSDRKRSDSADDDNKDQPKGPQSASEHDFRKLIIERCQAQFQKNNEYEESRVVKVKEIEECTDQEKKKDLQLVLEEYDRRARVRSVGNIRFIGELFKKQMLTSKIMFFCITHLLGNPDEENLECLCKLLTTVGKVLDTRKSQPDYLDSCFAQLADMAGKKNTGKKISSRIRFMMQDVIDLRANQWVPRRDENKPKTMDQIQKEAECERLEVQLNTTPISTPRKDDRTADRRRNRGGNSMEEGGWSQPVGKTRQTYAVETAKLNTKAPPPDQTRFGNKSAYAWGAQHLVSKTNKYALLNDVPGDLDKRPPIQVSGSRSTGPREYSRTEYKPEWENKSMRLGNMHIEGGRSQSITIPAAPSMKMKPQFTSIPAPGNTGSFSSTSSNSNRPRKTEDELRRVIKSMTDDASCETNLNSFIQNTLEQFHENFDKSSYELFVREFINGVLDKTAHLRRQLSELFSYMVKQNVLPLSLIQSELEKVLETADDLVIDIPKIWTYFAELLERMVVSNTHPLAEMKTTAAVLKNMGRGGGKLLGELLANLVRDQGPKWVKEKWDQSRLQWSDVTDTRLENVDDIIKKYNLEFLNGDGKGAVINSAGSQLTNDQIENHLVKSMRTCNFDQICDWILGNVKNTSDPQFIRALMTAILRVTVEERHAVLKLNENNFKNLQNLIKRFIDASAELELQCLYAIQAYNYKLEHPPGLMFSILTSLQQNDILSDEAFLTWESHTAEYPGHAVAIKGLTSFFTGLREPDSDDA